MLIQQVKLEYNSPTSARHPTRMKRCPELIQSGFYETMSLLQTCQTSNQFLQERLSSFGWLIGGKKRMQNLQQQSTHKIRCQKPEAIKRIYEAPIYKIGATQNSRLRIKPNVWINLGWISQNSAQTELSMRDMFSTQELSKEISAIRC